MIVATSFFSQEIISFPPAGLTWHWYANAWLVAPHIRAISDCDIGAS
jgi:hypothetical protein